MYVTEVLTRSKSGAVSHRCILLRESFRENGKVKNRTLANITNCSPKEIAAIRFALAHKHDLDSVGSLDQDLQLKQGLSVGAVLTVYAIARQVGIERALGTDRAAKLALLQVIARTVDQGSRLSAVRFAQDHAVCDILGISEGFSEDDLYRNLDWLQENQKRIQKRLFETLSKEKKPSLFLYDVTSSYLEGDQNEYGAYGYNRDGKKGKKQIVLGLLCTQEGDPVSVEVFSGNTNDLKTFQSQVRRAAEEYGCEDVTFVGDRGMIKKGQIEDLAAEGFHYITAITKPQIEGLLQSGVLQMSLFDEKVCEAVDGNIRYVLRRNPQRAEDLANSRRDKYASVAELIERIHESLADDHGFKVEAGLLRLKAKIDQLGMGGWITVTVEGKQLRLEQDAQALEKLVDGNPKAALMQQKKRALIVEMIEKIHKSIEDRTRQKVDAAMGKVAAKIERLNVSRWLKVVVEGGRLKLEQDDEVLKKESLLDGCYALKTDLSRDAASVETVHARYKDLTLVEQAFRTSKTVELEMRPWYVRTEESTRGHALVVMLAYMIVRRLQKAWREFDRTVEEGLAILKQLCCTEVLVKGRPAANQIPRPADMAAGLLKAAEVRIPKTIPALGAKVVSRHPLPKRRVTR